MSTITSKVQWTTAAIAVAAAATLTPIAFAAPGDDTSTDTTAGGAVGSTAGQAPTRSNRTNRPRPNDPPASDTQTGNTDNGGTTSGSTPSTGGATTGTTPDRASTDVTAPTAPATTPGTNAVGANPLFQNPLIWIGQPNPNPPASTPIYQFEPLGNLPAFSRPMFGWLENFNFEGCILGLSNVVQGTVGPYGTATQSVSTSGCA